MNTQQQSLNNLTTAIYDLIAVISNDRAMPRQNIEHLPAQDAPVSEPEPSSEPEPKPSDSPDGSGQIIERLLLSIHVAN